MEGVEKAAGVRAAHPGGSRGRLSTWRRSHTRRSIAPVGDRSIDEIDKIAGRESAHGPDVSREAQRDRLLIVEVA